ncbi:MAG TPA: marine proteobacterial sortase target protein [Xanthomonadaceae bacterium]|nr:marine proteobacterial sortase target protein [Xanthomonadaceae bacterium]
MSLRQTRKPRMFVPRPARRRRAAALAALLLGLSTLLQARAAPAPDEGLVLALPDGGWLPAAVLETEVHYRISGLIAEVEVRQRFVNDTDAWLEGRYLLPLPETSAVHALRVEAGGRVLEGEIREKELARIEYAAAAAEGHRSALVEHNRPNLFRTRVANIGPGEAVQVSVGFWQRVDYADGRFSVTLPLTLTPRYLPPGPCTAPCDEAPVAGDAHFLADGRYRSLQPTVAIFATLDPGLPVAAVESPTHAIDVDPAAGGYRVALADTVVDSDRDFVLSWTPAASAEVGSALFTQEVDGEHYALLMLVPPTLPMQPLPRELILVIDTSGSMHGVSIAQAKAALLHALDRLAPGDAFNVIRFDSRSEKLFESSVPADARHLAVARDFVSQLVADGGTDLGPALSLAFAGDPAPGLLRQVVLATDAAIGNEQALFAQIRAQLGEARLFPVGIGSAPNGWFLRESARLGRGSETVIRDLGEVDARMQSLFAKLDRPAMRDLEVLWPPGAESYPELLPDLYAGEPLLAVARLPLPDGELFAQGNSGKGPWNTRLKFDGRRFDDDGVGRLWAREKIATLEDALNAGVPEDEVRPQVLDTALRHHLVSRYTSLVAVDRTPVRPADAALDSTTFANATPHDALALAQGGLGTRSKLASALALALLALAIAKCRRVALFA